MTLTLPLPFRFWDFPKPSIVAVNGLAVGGAANICLANCHDLILASEEAKFMYPFAKLGITPEMGSSFLMPLLVGPTKAKRMMMLGEWLSAKDALDMNLVLEVLPAQELMPKAMAMAKTLAANKNQFALGLNKRLMNRHLRQYMEACISP